MSYSSKKPRVRIPSEIISKDGLLTDPYAQARRYSRSGKMITPKGVKILNRRYAKKSR